MGSGGDTYWVWDGLQAYWSFDGPTPASSDLGGVTGTLDGTASTSTVTLAAAFARSASFDGTEASRISLTSGASLGATSTVVFWAVHRNCSNNEIPFYFTDTCSYMGDQYFALGMRRCGGARLLMTTDLCAATTDQWVHTAYVDDGTEIRVYRDGARVTPDLYTYGTLSGMTLFRFGSEPGANSNSLHGYLDDVAVFSRALSATEISTLHAQAGRGRPFRWR